METTICEAAIWEGTDNAFESETRAYSLAGCNFARYDRANVLMQQILESTDNDFGSTTSAPAGTLQFGTRQSGGLPFETIQSGELHSQLQSAKRNGRETTIWRATIS